MSAGTLPFTSHSSDPIANSAPEDLLLLEACDGFPDSRTAGIQEKEQRDGDVVLESHAGADETTEEDVEEKVDTEEKEAAYDTVRRELCDAEVQKFRGTWKLEFLAHTAI